MYCALDRIYHANDAHFAQLRVVDGEDDGENWLLVDRSGGTTCVYSPLGQLKLSNPLQLPIAAGNFATCPVCDPQVRFVILCVLSILKMTLFQHGLLIFALVSVIVWILQLGWCVLWACHPARKYKKKYYEARNDARVTPSSIEHGSEAMGSITCLDESIYETPRASIEAVPQPTRREGRIAFGTPPPKPRRSISSPRFQTVEAEYHSSMHETSV